jgi:hypothetical protein
MSVAASVVAPVMVADGSFGLNQVREHVVPPGVPTPLISVPQQVGSEGTNVCTVLPYSAKDMYYILNTASCDGPGGFRMAHTTNGGRTWQIWTMPPIPTTPADGFAQVSRDRGRSWHRSAYVCGDQSDNLTTFDGKSAYLLCVTGVASSTLYRTTNNGDSWEVAGATPKGHTYVFPNLYVEPQADGSLLGITIQVTPGGTLVTNRGGGGFRPVPGVPPLTRLSRLATGGYLATGVLDKNQLPTNWWYSADGVTFAAVVLPPGSNPGR